LNRTGLPDKSSWQHSQNVKGTLDEGKVKLIVGLNQDCSGHIAMVLHQADFETAFGTVTGGRE